MFYGLATNKIRVPGYRFTHTLCDIETLNRRARERSLLRRHRHQLPRLSLSAEELHAHGLRRQRRRGLRPHGRLQPPLAPEDLGRIKIAVPGTLTTAYLALKIFNPDHRDRHRPLRRIIPEILAGNFEAGLIIHEGQLTYSSSGLYKVLDLGVWWRETTGLVLPLGGNAIRRSLGNETLHIVTKALRDSIQHALDHREEALEYAMQFARDLDARLANRFVSMYVNERTLDYGPDGRQAIRQLLDMGYERGIIPIAPRWTSSTDAFRPRNGYPSLDALHPRIPGDPTQYLRHPQIRRWSFDSIQESSAALLNGF